MSTILEQVGPNDKHDDEEQKKTYEEQDLIDANAYVANRALQIATNPKTGEKVAWMFEAAKKAIVLELQTIDTCWEDLFRVKNVHSNFADFA